MSGQTYTKELRLTLAQLKDANKKVNDLRKRRRKLEEQLVKYMEQHHITRVEEFEIDKLRYKPKAPPKPKKHERDKRRDATELFRQIGIINPEKLYEEVKDRLEN